MSSCPALHLRTSQGTRKGKLYQENAWKRDKNYLLNKRIWFVIFDFNRLLDTQRIHPSNQWWWEGGGDRTRDCEEREEGAESKERIVRITIIKYLISGLSQEEH